MRVAGPHCDLNEVEDEKHFILDCTLYDKERSIFFTSLNSFTQFQKLDKENKFSFLVSYNKGDIEMSKLIVNFICNCFDKRASNTK
jgi:hypothetical protein